MRRAFRLKLRLFSGLIFLIAFVLISRLYFVQVVHGADFALKGERQYASSQSLYDRGTIYFTGKDGVPLSAAAVATGFLIALDPKHLTDAEAAYAAITPILPLDHDEFFTAAAKTDDPYEVLEREVSEDVGVAIQELDIPGVIVERERWRTYPSGEKAAPTIGFVAYDEENTITGRYGLERYYEDVLVRGNEGLFGNFFAELFANLDSVVSDARRAREGDVITSIDPVIQEKLDQVLRDIQSDYGSAETGGIIMDPETGEIYALDTYPTFDPNEFGTADVASFGNPIVENRYEFGSIVKALTMTAGLDSGAVVPSTTYNDTGCMTLNSKTICNYDLKARGVIPMQEVLSHSLNMGATFVALKVGHEHFRDYFTRLGLGTETGIDLPSEIHGDIRNLSSTRDIEYATASFGQGIATTPIETIRALGALANDGAIVTPHVARAIRLESGVEKKLVWGEPQQVFSPSATRQVTDMLVEVVDDALANGSVKIDDMSVAAKTGTAQIAGPGGKYQEGAYFHSFFGYFPASDPRYIILLYTKEPQGVQYASETLTHPFMDLTHFLMNYADLPPDRGPKAVRP